MLYIRDILTDDVQVEQRISERIGVRMPEECREGVVRNARLIQCHIDILQGQKA